MGAPLGWYALHHLPPCFMEPHLRYGRVIFAGASVQYMLTVLEGVSFSLCVVVMAAFTSILTWAFLVVQRVFIVVLIVVAIDVSLNAWVVVSGHVEVGQETVFNGIVSPLPFRSPELPERAGTFCRNVVIL